MALLSMNTESQEGQYTHTNSSTWMTNFLRQMGTLPSKKQNMEDRMKDGKTDEACLAK